MTDSTIAELIKRRRLQVLIHSIIYYKLNANVIDDTTWSKWALELEELQNKYPEIASTVIFAEGFKDFEHSSGFNLPLDNPWAVNRARYILELHNNNYASSLISREVLTDSDVCVAQPNVDNTSTTVKKKKKLF